MNPFGMMKKALRAYLRGNEVRYLALRQEFYNFMARWCHLWDAHQRRLLKKIRSGSGWSVSLGSGRRPFAGWLLVDAEPNGPENYLRHDLRRPLPFGDGTVERILIEHYFEHCEPRREVPRLLAECRRVLREGGTLRIIVPDAGAYCRAYASGDAEQWKRLGWEPGNLPADMPTAMSVLNHVFLQNGEHKAGWDFETLRLVLERAGFRDVERMAFGKSRDPGMTIDRPNHAPYSLYVEARK
jgi:predicted SAM-dependent methyltransferase